MPKWARPPFYGALFVLLLVGARAAIFLPFIVIGALVTEGLDGLIQVLWVGVVAALAGFAGGTAYAVADPVLGRAGRPGRYATWWLAVAAYLGVLMPMFGSDDPASRHHWDARDPVGWVIVAVLAVVFGSAVASALESPSSKSRRAWVQRKQRVTSRVPPPAS